MFPWKSALVSFVNKCRIPGSFYRFPLARIPSSWRLNFGTTSWTCVTPAVSFHGHGYTVLSSSSSNHRPPRTRKLSLFVTKWHASGPQFFTHFQNLPESYGRCHAKSHLCLHVSLLPFIRTAITVLMILNLEIWNIWSFNYFCIQANLKLIG